MTMRVSLARLRPGRDRRLVVLKRGPGCVVAYSYWARLHLTLSWG